MAILLQILGGLISLVLLAEGLKRLGIDVGWLNPLSFWHRWRWRQKVQTPALYRLQHPVDVVGAMAAALLQATGLVSEQQKAGLVEILQRHLSLTADEASKLWISSAHLLRQRPLEASEVHTVFAPCADKFSDYHVQTLRQVLAEVVALAPPANAAQQALMNAVEAFFQKRADAKKPWAG